MRTDLRVRDLGVAVAFLAGGLLLVLIVPEAAVQWSRRVPDDAARWPDLVALAVAALGQTQRRTRPVLGFAAATAALAAGPLLIGFTSTGVLIMFGDLLYCAVRYSSRRASWALAATVGAVVTLTAGAVLVSAGPGPAVHALLNLWLLGVPVMWALEVRQYHEKADAERERAAQMRRMAELDRAAAVTAERTHMARDLHDVIAGQVSAIAIRSEAALAVPDPDPRILREALAAVRRDSLASLTEMRAMIGLLRADDSASAEPRTAPAGLDRLTTLVDSVRGAGVRVVVDDRRPPGAVASAAVDLAAYRIVQESLTNATKHAPGSTVHLALRQQAGELVIELENDLVSGAQAAGGTGTGLLGLQERADAVGGTTEAGPCGRTWSVRAVLPVAAEAGG